MQQKYLGYILIVLGLIVATFTIGMKTQADTHVDTILEETGTCYTPEGECMHEQNLNIYLFGGIPAAALIILGLYLAFFDKTYTAFIAQQKEFATELKVAKEKDVFTAYIAGFTPEEQSIIKAVKEQEGIKQSTLRYKVGMSKAMLSIIINSLEKRDILTKKKAGKTNEIYLRKKF
jgi:DNA-binding MarR family transcriptional regulator